VCALAVLFVVLLAGLAVAGYYLTRRSPLRAPHAASSHAAPEPHDDF